MQALIKQIQALQASEINNLVESRLKEFEQFKNKNNSAWFSELCFCILAANSKQKTAAAIEKQLSISKIDRLTEKQLAKLIKDNKHRFHNNKSKYIKEAMQHKNIKTLLSKQADKRNWLIKNIKGLGFKEASHFLRNTGTTNLAILDRHIVNTMLEFGIIEKPKTMTPKLYLSIEEKFNNLARKLNMSPAKLDLFIWHIKTGEIAK
jgi:N-glycosylase/DNA lyase